MVKMNFDTAAKHTGLGVGMLEVIKACNSLLRVNFPLRRDDGRYQTKSIISIAFLVYYVFLHSQL